MSAAFWNALAAISAAVPSDPAVWIVLFGCAAAIGAVWSCNSGTTQILEGNDVVRSRIHAGHSGPIPGRTHQTSRNNYIEDSDVTTGAGSISDSRSSASSAASAASAASTRTRARK
jgi:hypothetical protein